MDSYNSKTKYVLHIENSARKSRNIFSNFLTNIYQILIKQKLHLNQ